MRDHVNLLFLFRQLLARELEARYKSTLLGGTWLVAQPLLMLCVYTLVFNHIFEARWPGAESTGSFALVLFVGLIVFNLFSEVITSAPSLVAAQPNLVKKVVFPVELLVVVRVAAALVTALISLGILFCAHLLIEGPPSHWFLASAVPLLAMTPMMLGIAWIMSSLGVYLRDISQFMGVISSVFLFISPIFFPPSAMPQSLTFLVKLNPLVLPIEQLRAVTLAGTAPDLVALAAYFCVSSVFAAIALQCFRRLSTGFADVL